MIKGYNSEHEIIVGRINEDIKELEESYEEFDINSEYSVKVFMRDVSEVCLDTYDNVAFLKSNTTNLDDEVNYLNIDCINLLNELRSIQIDEEDVESDYNSLISELNKLTQAETDLRDWFFSSSRVPTLFIIFLSFTLICYQTIKIYKGKLSEK
jgi:hypothetical protein